MTIDSYGTEIRREGLAASFEGSCKYLETHSALDERLKNLIWMVPGTLFDASPSDFESLAKIGYEPFAEAQTDFELTVASILQGAYKTGYHHLRSFFELYVVGLYCLLPTTPKASAHAWLKGNADTPFFKRMLNALFQEPNFQFAQSRFRFKEQLIETYRLLCKYVHSGGPQYRHRHLSRANFPRFNAVALDVMVNDLHRVLGDISTAFVLYSPVLLAPLPVEQKFGINGPVSGYREEGQVENLRFAIGADRLVALDELVDADPDVRSVKEWFLSHPDITDEELRQQFAEQEAFLEAVRPKDEDGVKLGDFAPLFANPEIHDG
jgi:hypothetical protein